jgi:hypothetical protein
MLSNPALEMNAVFAAPICVGTGAMGVAGGF